MFHSPPTLVFDKIYLEFSNVVRDDKVEQANEP